LGKYLGGLALPAVLLTLPFPMGAAMAASGDTIVVYGGDLAPAERQELAQLFGQGATATIDTVTAAEVIAAERGTGSPPPPPTRRSPAPR
jgi:uncharacterized protein YpuA (DUF1002 family)